jgi:hypothetical protein
MKVRRTKAAVAVSAALAVGLLTGCGGGGLSANSSCQDFMNASPQDQDQAVSQLASQLHAPDAVTPLGRPNIDYLCTNEPNDTLGWAISHTG